MILVPLESMTAGEHGVVHTLDGAPDFIVRLEEMGLREGTAVQMVRSGSPCILAVNEHRLSLRFDNKATVLVELTK